LYPAAKLDRVELRGHPKQGAHIDERRVDRGQLGEGARNHEREHGIPAVRGLEIEVALRDLPVTGVVMHCDRQALAQEHLHVVGRGMIALVVAVQESTCAREACQGEPFGCRIVDGEAEQRWRGRCCPYMGAYLAIETRTFCFVERSRLRLEADVAYQARRHRNGARIIARDRHSGTLALAFRNLR